MPLIQVLCAPTHVSRCSKDLQFVRELAGRLLSVAEWPIDSSHISIVLLPTAAGIQIGDVEILIFGHEFAERLSRKDEICTKMRSELEGHWGVQVRVWLVLSEVGFGKKVIRA